MSFCVSITLLMSLWYHSAWCQNQSNCSDVTVRSLFWHHWPRCRTVKTSLVRSLFWHHCDSQDVGFPFIPINGDPWCPHWTRCRTPLYTHIPYSPLGQGRLSPLGCFTRWCNYHTIKPITLILLLHCYKTTYHTHWPHGSIVGVTKLDMTQTNQ